MTIKEAVDNIMPSEIVGIAPVANSGWFYVGTVERLTKNDFEVLKTLEKRVKLSLSRGKIEARRKIKQYTNAVYKLKSINFEIETPKMFATRLQRSANIIFTSIKTFEKMESIEQKHKDIADEIVISDKRIRVKSGYTINALYIDLDIHGWFWDEEETVYWLETGRDLNKEQVKQEKKEDDELSTEHKGA